MKVWNICLYLAIFSLACSCMVTLVPFIFPEQADVITSAIPSAGALKDAMDRFLEGMGAVGSAPDFATGLGLVLETIVHGFQLIGAFFWSAIATLPEIVGAFNLGVGAMAIVGVLESILYIMLVVALIQLVTGRYFINVE